MRKAIIDSVLGNVDKEMMVEGFGKGCGDD